MSAAPGDTEAPAPSARPDSGAASEAVAISPGTFEPSDGEAFRVVAFIRIAASTGADGLEVSMNMTVQVVERYESRPIRDAIVVGGALGRATRAAPSGPGKYTLQEREYAPFYELSVERPGAALRGVRLKAPGLGAVRAAARERAARVEWSPSREPWVNDVGVSVFGLDLGTRTYHASGRSDFGVLELPARATPSAGAYLVTVRRATSLDLVTPSSVAFVELETHAPMLVP